MGAKRAEGKKKRSSSAQCVSTAGDKLRLGVFSERIGADAFKTRRSRQQWIAVGQLTLLCALNQILLCAGDLGRGPGQGMPPKMSPLASLTYRTVDMYYQLISYVQYYLRSAIPST